MEKVEEPMIHQHPLIPCSRFAFSWCRRCTSRSVNQIYGGYRCNEQGSGALFHKDCIELLQEINHLYHPDHSLKLIHRGESNCTLCGNKFSVGYSCSICDFKLDFVCARSLKPLLIPENICGHKHPLQLFREEHNLHDREETCKACPADVNLMALHYRCSHCKFVIHVNCADLFQEAYHNSHPQHPLKSIQRDVLIPDYADKSCLLCEEAFVGVDRHFHHCDVCNFSICRACMKNPPPVNVQCPTTHEHQLHLIPRRINFTCNACGTLGDRSPYFCLQCNFMIHRQCINLPRVININHHDHRISYSRRLGHMEWKCRVCREKVDCFYGAYTCMKCPTFVVHARCATDEDVWDMVEREGTPEEEEIAPLRLLTITP